MYEPIYEGIDQLDSFDAYYANIYLDKRTLMIPYINLGLVNHPLHRGGDRPKYIDFAYTVFAGLRYLKVKKGILLGEENQFSPHLYFGGINLDLSTDLIDFEIVSDTAYLLPLPTSRLSDTIWVPVVSPMQNLSEGTVAAFFRGEMMPESIRELLGTCGAP